MKREEAKHVASSSTSDVTWEEQREVLKPLWFQIELKSWFGIFYFLCKMNENESTFEREF